MSSRKELRGLVLPLLINASSDEHAHKLYCCARLQRNATVSSHRPPAAAVTMSFSASIMTAKLVALSGSQQSIEVGVHDGCVRWHGGIVGRCVCAGRSDAALTQHTRTRAQRTHAHTHPGLVGQTHIHAKLFPTSRFYQISNINVEVGAWVWGGLGVHVNFLLSIACRAACVCGHTAAVVTCTVARLSQGAQHRNCEDLAPLPLRRSKAIEEADSPLLSQSHSSGGTCEAELKCGGAWRRLWPGGCTSCGRCVQVSSANLYMCFPGSESALDLLTHTTHSLFNIQRCCGRCAPC